MEISNQKKVLLVVTLFSVGGATETVVALGEGLRKRGMLVDIVTGLPLENEGDMSDAARRCGLNVILLSQLVRNINPFKDLFALVQLFVLMRQGRYDVVHTNSSKAGIIGRVAARMAGVKTIIHTNHGLPYHDFQPSLVRRAYILFEKIGARFCDGIISVTHAIVENCLSHGIGRREQYTVIRSCFDVNLFLSSARDHVATRQKYGFKESDVVAGTISRFALLKGHEYIIQAAAMLRPSFPQLKFFFVGDGEIRNDLLRQIAELGLRESFVFSGMVDPDQIPSMIAAMDFVIHPSLREGLARVLPQAIIMGKKVVTFAIEGVDEVIVEGKTGYAIPTGSITSLQQKCELLTSTPELRVVPEMYRQKISMEFDVATMVEQTVTFYSKCAV